MRAAGPALLALGLALVAPVSTGPDGAARAELLVRIHPQDRAELLTGERGGRQRPLYRTPEGRLADALVSPGERSIAVLRTFDGVWREDRGWATPPRNDLVLLSRDGRVLHRVGEDVRRFVFSPDARQLAYIAGRYADGGIGFEPSGVKVLELASGAVRQVPLHPRWIPYDLHWTQTRRENVILIKVLGDREIQQLEYRPRDPGPPASSDSRAFHLSPDGSFFYRSPQETILAGHCRLGENGDSCFEVGSLEDPGSALESLSAAELGRPHGWVGAAGRQLLYSRPTYRKTGPSAEAPQPGLVLEQMDNVILDAGRTRPTERPVARFQGKVSRGAALGDWSCCAAHVVYWPVGMSAEEALLRGLEIWPPPVRPAPPRPKPVPSRLRALPELLDFESDAAGRPLATGEIVREQWAAMGIHVSGTGPSGVVAMVFDSAHPTGGDPDLGAPHRDFGGPGVGDGGRAGSEGENREPQGKILVLAPPGRAGDPGDSLSGGTIAFAFDREVELVEVHLLDVDDDFEAGEVVALDGSGYVLARSAMRPLGDNSFQRLRLAADEARRLEVRFPASGALAAVRFARRDAAPLTDLVRAWAAAWQEHRPEDFLSYYADDFRPASGISVEAWRRERRERILGPRMIRVGLERIEAWYTGADTASVRFEQAYESDRLRERVTKVLDLVAVDDVWKIVGEWVLE